jgi:hypothetical protein
MKYFDDQVEILIENLRSATKHSSNRVRKSGSRANYLQMQCVAAYMQARRLNSRDVVHAKSP